MSLSTMGIAACCVIATLATGCAASTNDGSSDDTGDSADALLAGTHLTAEDVAGLVRDAGFPESLVGPMVCTAKYESSFYERATNKNRNGTMDRGLFQINSVHLGDEGCPDTAEGTFDAAANVKCARVIQKSQGINAWYGYKKHKAECDRYQAP